MAERVYSALNTGGTSRLTANDQLAAQAQDHAVRQALLAEQARQFNMNYGDRANARAFQQNLQGTFADRTRAGLDLQALANTGQRDIVREQGATQLGLADKANTVPLARFGLEERQFNEGSDLRRAQAQAGIEALEQDRAIGRLINEQFTGGTRAAPTVSGVDLGGGVTIPGFSRPSPLLPAAPASPAAGMDRELLSLLLAARNRQALPDLEGRAESREDRRIERERGNKRYDQEEAMRRFQAGAAAPGDVPPLAVEAFLGSDAGQSLTANLGKNTAAFVDRDTSVTGWDPGERDIAAIVGERDRVAQALVSRGYDRATAVKEANRIITESLGPDANDMNSGRTQDLLVRLGLSG